MADGDAIATGRAAEHAARQSYGRLVAYLARSWRDLAAVEDALGEAFARALEVWPRRGVPDNPDAWLLVAGAQPPPRRGAGRQGPRRCRRLAHRDRTGRGDGGPARIPDKRLELMFVCAHPAIDPAMHAPLMLQAVLGLGAARDRVVVSRLARHDGPQRSAAPSCGSATPASPSRCPSRTTCPHRMASVLEAIYAAYGRAGTASPATTPAAAAWRRKRSGSRGCSSRSRPTTPRRAGCSPSCCSARRAPARGGSTGAMCRSPRQDLDRWDRPMLAEAEATLRAAAGLAAPALPDRGGDPVGHGPVAPYRRRHAQAAARAPHRTDRLRADHRQPRRPGGGARRRGRRRRGTGALSRLPAEKVADLSALLGAPRSPSRSH